MSMLRNAVLLVLISVSAAFAQQDNNSTFGSLGQPFITSFPAKQYHAHPNNYDVLQDKDGILYFGNLWCVLQFDGTLWRNIYLPNGASCTSLALDSDGTIYVGGRNAIGYLKTDSIGRKSYVSLLNDLSDEDRRFKEIWRTVVSPEGVFFMSYEKLFFLSKKTRKLKAIRDTPWYVYHVLDETYITDREGLFVFKNDAIRKVPNAEIFDGKFINGMTHLGDKLLVSTSGAGIFLFDGEKAVLWKSPVNEILRDYNPTKIENIGNQHLVIATELNGLLITDLQGNIISHFNKGNGLAANTVSGFYLDKNNLLWLTLYNGVAFIPMFKQVSYINEYANVAGIPYSSAVYDGKLYLATSEGLFSMPLDDRKQKKFTRITNGLIWSLAVIDDKLFCGQAITAFVVDHGKIETIYEEGTWMFLPGSDPNSMMMGTYSGLHFIKKQNGRWRYDKKIKGFNNEGRSFAIDKLGDVWVSHDNRGIFKLRLNAQRDSVTQSKCYSKEGGLPLSNGNSIVRFRDDILISTTQGVYKYDYEAEQIIPHREINKILGGRGYLYVKRIIPENVDNIWVVDSNGVLVKFFVSKDSVELLQSTELLRANLITDFEHVNPLAEAVVVGTLDGFALYRQHKNDSVETPLRVYISKIESAGRIYCDGDYALSVMKVPVPYDENALKFTFASNSYEDLNTNQYQYYLEGFSDGNKWSSSTFVPFKEYTNLHEGNYRLHVRTINFRNKVSDEIVVAFTVLPPWYRSLLAYFAYGLIFIALNYVFYKRIQQKIQKEKKRVAQEEQHQLWLRQKEWEEINLNNEKQMMALQHEKLEIERAALEEKETMLEKEKERDLQVMALEKEKLEADIRHKNNELTSLTLHIAQKNEMIHKIANQLTKTIQDSGDDVAVRNLKEIRTSLQKGLDSDQEWEKFTDHFDTVHEGFLKRLKIQYPDLSSSTLKLCAFIKMRLSSKQIASLMNTAPDSVLKARYRLRTKFNLAKETGLEEFLNNF
jgi:ligand-binding sensor domain-containing protein